MLVFRPVVSVLVKFVMRSFSTNSRPQAWTYVVLLLNFGFFFFFFFFFLLLLLNFVFDQLTGEALIQF
jgi:hypothetical protein